MAAIFSSRVFNRNPASVKRAAQAGPVFITDRNKPSLVVLAIRDYERLTGRGRSLLDVLTTGDDHDFDFDAPRSSVDGRSVDLD